MSELILDLRPANERRRYFVTTSLIGWAGRKPRISPACYVLDRVIWMIHSWLYWCFVETQNSACVRPVHIWDPNFIAIAPADVFTPLRAWSSASTEQFEKLNMFSSKFFWISIVRFSLNIADWVIHIIQNGRQDFVISPGISKIGVHNRACRSLWRPLQGQLSWCPILKAGHCNSFEDRAHVEFINRCPIFKSTG